MTKAQYLAKRKALLEEMKGLKDQKDVVGFNAKKTEIETLKADWDAEVKMQADLQALEDQSIPAAMQNSGSTVINNAPTQNSEPEDIFATLQYRKDFMAFCKTGERTPEFSAALKTLPKMVGADEFTTTTEAAAVIPSTILEKIIDKMEAYGQIFSRVTKINIQGGVTVPISTIKPTASWITQSTPSEKQKLDMSTSVSFNYYGLECKVATSLVAAVTTLKMFETKIMQLIAEAMVKALDIGAIAGTGSGQMLGVTVDARVTGLTGHVITLSSSEFADWSAWKKKVFAKIPLAYRAGGAFSMAAGTFEGYIDGMVDANGQPIGRVNYGIADKPVERFGGREVLLVEDDVIDNYADASTADVVAVYCKWADYIINSNLELRMYRYEDHDLNQIVDKAILVADGKIGDPNGVFIIKKGA